MKHVFLLFLLALLGLGGRPAAGQVTATLTGKVLSLSDIHFGVPDATLYDSLQLLPVTQWEQRLKLKKYGNDTITIQAGTSYGPDTNYWLLTSTLDAVQARCPQPDFIVITGDMLAHNLTGAPADCNRFALMRGIYQFLEMQFRRRFPHAVVLPGLGNNDTDMQDDDPPSPRFREMFAQVWAPRLYAGQAEQQRFIDEFTARGYYSYDLPGGPGRRLVMLNSVLFLNHSAADPQQKQQQATQQLGWLIRQLRQAAPTDRLWLAMHVPPGINAYVSTGKCDNCLTGPGPGQPGATTMWVDSVTTRYRRIVAAHRQVIRGGLAGHTHMDEFRLLTDQDDHVVTFLRVTPSVSPGFLNNPAFQVLDYDPATLALRDVHTHYLNLKVLPPSTIPIQVKSPATRWHLEYTFSSTYLGGKPGIDVASLQQVWQELGKFDFGHPTSKQFKYATYFTASAPAPAGPSPQRSAAWPYYWCTIGKTTPEEFCQCLGYWQKTYGPAAPKARRVARVPPPR